MNLGELIADIRETLEDTGTNQNVTDAWITARLNEAQRRFAAATGFYKDSTTFASVAGENDYDLDAVVIGIERVQYDGTWLVDMASMPQVDAEHLADSTTGASWPRYFTHRYRTLYIWPAAVDDGKNLVAWWYGLPPDMVDSNDPHYLPPQYEYLLQRWVMVQFNYKNEEFAQAKMLEQDWDEKARDSIFKLAHPDSAGPTSVNVED